MVLKNLLRRRGRTLLTVLGIAIGVAAIIGLGTMADGLEAGYGTVISGSNADLVLSDPEAFDIILSSVEEDIGDELSVMSEVAQVSPLLQGLVQAEANPYFFVFGYEPDSFVLERFQIVEGVGLDSREAQEARGRPALLGSGAADAMSLEVGDTVRLSGAPFRVVGIYETGDAFEEGGAVLPLEEAQLLLGMQRQVSLIYIQLRDPSLADRLRDRVERVYPDLALSTTAELSDRTSTADSLRAVVWGVAALAILIGGVGMTNAQLMSVYERTREIGVLRAVGWKRWRILRMILTESVLVSLLGGLLGTALAWGALTGLSGGVLSTFGASGSVRPTLLLQAFAVVMVLGIVGGLLPATRAAQLQPIEALRYEGGAAGKNASRLPIGGMALQNLWRRKTRTLLTLAVIGITVGAIMTLDATMRGVTDMMTDFAAGAEVMVRQRDAADLSVAFIDERIGDRVARVEGVANVSGILFTAFLSDEYGIFVIQGYEPRGAAINKFNVVEGETISTNRQIMIGRALADAQDVTIGETLNLNGYRYRVVGIFESGSAWEELGGVITLRDAQAFAGRPNKVTFFTVDMVDPNQAEAVAAMINEDFPEAHASLSGEFANSLPDLENAAVMTDSIAVMAVVVGGIGMMNTMLMAVLERTREIGVLRALGWRRRRILSLILRESLLLGLVGAAVGIGVAFALAGGLQLIPSYGDALQMDWSSEVFIRSIGVALTLAMLGGAYPALRATQLRPIEALRYE